MKILIPENSDDWRWKLIRKWTKGEIYAFNITSQTPKYFLIKLGQTNAYNTAEEFPRETLLNTKEN